MLTLIKPGVIPVALHDGFVDPLCPSSEDLSAEDFALVDEITADLDEVVRWTGPEYYAPSIHELRDSLDSPANINRARRRAARLHRRVKARHRRRLVRELERGIAALTEWRATLEDCKTERELYRSDLMALHNLALDLQRVSNQLGLRYNRRLAQLALKETRPAIAGSWGRGGEQLRRALLCLTPSAERSTLLRLAGMQKA